MRPEISVIVPVYKVEKYLHRCVDSILNQTFRDFELILVDDGSPDNCGAICDEYAEKDNRIRVIHKKNGGVSSARNAGIDWAFTNSKSRWLTFVDSDDWVHPQYFDLLMLAAKTCDKDIAVTGFQQIHGNEEIIASGEGSFCCWKPEDYYVEQTVNAVVAWGKLYRKDCFREIRYPVGKIHEDEFVTYRVLFRQDQIVVIDIPLYYYCVNPDSIMRSKWSEKRFHCLEALDAQIAFFTDNQYPKALKRAKMRLFRLCEDYLRRIQGKEWRKTRRSLRLRIRRYLSLYKRELGLSIETEPGIYEAAYPRFMEMYWILQVIKKKLF